VLRGVSTLRTLLAQVLVLGGDCISQLFSPSVQSFLFVL